MRRETGSKSSAFIVQPEWVLVDVRSMTSWKRLR
jgi:hypothetical protein